MCFNVSSPALAAAASLSAAHSATKKTFEYVAQTQITKIDIHPLATTTEYIFIVKATSAATSPTNTCVTKLIITLAFVFILKYFVGFGNFFKFFFISALFVGVMLHRLFTKSLLDFIL